MTEWRQLRNGVVLAACALGLAACGVKSAPQHPESSRFPRAYPAAPANAPAYTLPERPAPAATAPAPAAPPAAGGIYQYPNAPEYRPPEN